MSNAADKIRKLLNMTVANGCSEDEQETALRMAAGIAAREGIDLAVMQPKDAPLRKAQLKALRQEMKLHQAFLAETAAILYGIECNVYDYGKSGVSFVGREELIDLAETTMFWLFRQVEELYKQSLPKGLTKVERGEFRRTFKPACALRTKERAMAMMRDLKRNDASAQAATGQNALVVQGYYDQVKGEVDAFWNERFAAAHARAAAWRLANPELAAAADEAAEKAPKPRARREREMPTGSGTNAGYRAGDRVQLNKQVH